MSELMKPAGYRLQAQSDWQVPEAVEDASSFVENALIKARNAALHTGLPAIADDSGLVVPALNGAPGIYSARYAGQSGDSADRANNQKLLLEINALEDADRVAYFHCAMVMVLKPNDPVPLIASANWYGKIAREECGCGGFGYDPLFYLPGLGCTSAELEAGRKNRISHRGLAARKLIRMIEAGND